MHTPWWLLPTLAVLLVVLALDVIAGIRLSYFRASAKVRAGLAGATLHHYVRVEHLVPAVDAAVTVAVQHRFYVTGIGPGLARRSTAAYYYVGRNGRGGRVNHNAREHRQAAYARVDVRGSDFLTWLGDRPMKYRSWDRAVMVRDTYTGPGVVVYSDHPLVDRKRRDPQQPKHVALRFRSVKGAAHIPAEYRPEAGP